mgnify:CR=1 FL=1
MNIKQKERWLNHLKNKKKKVKKLSKNSWKKKYKKYLLSNEWAQLKIDLFEYRGKECEKCGEDYYCPGGVNRTKCPKLASTREGKFRVLFMQYWAAHALKLQPRI